MANLFKNRQAAGQLSERQLLENKFKTARSSLLLIIIFTLVNVVLTMTQADLYFLFSAYLPFFSVVMGMFWCGKYSDEYYELAGGKPLEFWDESIFYALVAIAFVMIALYIVCWVMSKNYKSAWFIVALVLFAIDTGAMFLIAGFAMDSIIDYVFHAWVIYELIVGITSCSKIKNLPPEEEVTEEIVLDGQASEAADSNENQF